MLDDLARCLEELLVDLQSLLHLPGAIGCFCLFEELLKDLNGLCNLSCFLVQVGSFMPAIVVLISSSSSEFTLNLNEGC